MSDWKTITIGEVLTLQRGFDLPTNDRVSGQYPVVASTGVVGYHDVAMVKGPGVVIGRSGSIGGGQYIVDDYWPLNTTLWVKDFMGNDPQFCYFMLKSLSLNYLNAGTGVPTLNRNHVHQIIINVPIDVVEQHVIAHILGTLDDKIELNRRMNETLEGIARALFKSWFIDFDPVRAKAQGLQPFGMDEETSALFPDQFEDSELGEIPKGWIIKPLDEIADFKNGLAMQKYPPTGKDFLPVIKIAELNRGISENTSRASIEVPSECIVENGDVLFSWSGSLELIIWCGGKGALNQHLFKVTSNENPRWLYYHWVGYHLDSFRRIAAGKATTMGHIQKHHLSEALTVLPPREVLDKVSQTFGPIIEQYINNNENTMILESVRNLLLPKLISGDIQIDPSKFGLGPEGEKVGEV